MRFNSHAVARVSLHNASGELIKRLVDYEPPFDAADGVKLSSDYQVGEYVHIARITASPAGPDKNGEPTFETYREAYVAAGEAMSAVLDELDVPEARVMAMTVYAGHADDIT